MSAPAPRTPVLVGVGQITNRGDELVDPITLAAEATRRALADCGAHLSVDTVAMPGVLSPRTEHAAHRLAAALGLAPRRLLSSTIGGNTPQWLVGALGGDHLALASYNAGKSRVDRWLAERPGLPPDEFIDDIPFPETQNYVKRILGTAEDYRRLYGDTGLSAAGPAAPARSVVPTRATPRSAVSAPAKTPPRKAPAAKAPTKKAPPKRPPARRAPARGD